MFANAGGAAMPAGWLLLVLLWALLMALALWGISRLLPTPRARHGTAPPHDPAPAPEAPSRRGSAQQRCPVVDADLRGAGPGPSTLPASPARRRR